MAKHTAGPWHRNIPPASHYPVIFAGRNTHIAAVLGGARHGKALSEEEIEANCDLITAAPQMLAEFKRLYEHFSAWVALHPGDATAETDAILHCSMQAIRNAEGL